MKFGTILADPPWSFGNIRSSGDRTNGKGGQVRLPSDSYDCMTSRQIARLPVETVCSENCALLMWSTWAHLAEALSIIEAWGFTYKTGLPWVKMWRDATPRRGSGLYHANCSEPLLIATMGKGLAPGANQLGAIFHPSGQHSAKPDDQYGLAERYPGPYLEMFARPDDGGLFPPRQGWTFIGNGATGRDIRDDLRLLAETEK